MKEQDKTVILHFRFSNVETFLKDFRFLLSLLKTDFFHPLLRQKQVAPNITYKTQTSFDSF